MRWEQTLASAPDPVAGLIDMPLPQAVSLWPQTWPARTAIVVAVIALIATVWWIVRRRRSNRYRREALAELHRIERGDTGDTRAVAAELAALVRRTALAAFPREQVVALTGPAWLAFLDRAYRGGEFTRGAGRALEAAYRPMPPEQGALSALIDLVRRWIRHHA
jgi:Ca-activated chloride channel family protein